MALLGIPIGTLLLADVITTIYALFLHNRLVPKLGVLERVFVTPSHHRVHHARNPEYLDKNFASMFIVWDHLFGTFAEEAEAPVFGLTTPLRVHNVVWARFHVGFEIVDRMRRARGLGQKLLAPLRPPEWDPDGRHELAPAAARPVPLVSRASTAARVYAFAQYVVLFVLVFAFTFMSDETGIGFRFALAAWLVASLGVVGALLDARPWAVRLEATRWAIALAAVCVLRGW